MINVKIPYQPWGNFVSLLHLSRRRHRRPWPPMEAAPVPPERSLLKCHMILINMKYLTLQKPQCTSSSCEYHHLSDGCDLFPCWRQTLACSQIQLSSFDWFSWAVAQNQPKRQNYFTECTETLWELKKPGLFCPTSCTFCLARLSDGCMMAPITLAFPHTTRASSGESVLIPTRPWQTAASGADPRCHKVSLSVSNWPGLDALRCWTTSV